jgi:signal peptidase II
VIGPLILIIGVLALDIVSKAMAEWYLSHSLPCVDFPFAGIPIFENFCGGIDFCLHYMTNHGVAWGLGADFQELLVLLRVVLVVGLFLYFMFSFKMFAYRYPLAMIVAGGFGNIIDYFIYGYVIDMFHFTFWGYSYPVFNIADTSICLGLCCFLINAFFLSKKKSCFQP